MLLFEVLGEEPTLPLIISIFVGLGAIGLFLSIFRWWSSIPIVVLLSLYGWLLLDDFFAQDLYPAIMHEDPKFIPIATVVIALGLILPLVGIGLNFCERLYKAK